MEVITIMYIISIIAFVVSVFIELKMMKQWTLYLMWATYAVQVILGAVFNISCV